MKSRDSLPETIGMVALALFFAVVLGMLVIWCVKSFDGAFSPRRWPPQERLTGG